jgi:hypothetical protein
VEGLQLLVVNLVGCCFEEFDTSAVSCKRSTVNDNVLGPRKFGMIDSGIAMQQMNGLMKFKAQ